MISTPNTPAEKIPLPLASAFGAFALLALSALLLFVGACEKKPAPIPTPADLNIAGHGFLVWERRTDSGWELWTMNLDGSGEKQLVEPHPKLDYFCPHISPDGRHLAYMTYKKGATAYDDDAVGSLRLFSFDSGKDRLLVPKARSYQEDRAAVWIDHQRLIYIAGDGFTEQINIDNGSVTRLTNSPSNEFGWLVDPSLNWATTGTPEFAPYLQNDLAVQRRNAHGGCQPYFARDGVWGFWVGGAGGPFARIHLPTGEISPILEQHDARMPEQQNYSYFPMLSPCQNLIAFAASTGQHDHFEANYDIFVARIDPHTLELIGRPARFTSFEGNDRFPDVYLAPLPLGRHSGEAPLKISFKTPEQNADWEWRFGPGVTVGPDEMTHTFAEPGDYVVTATQKISETEEETLTGHVHVRPASPPKISTVRLSSPKEILVFFDQDIHAEKAAATLASGKKFAALESRPDGRSLRLTLADPLDQPDTLVLEKITDRAQSPNPLPKTELPLAPGVWPSNENGLVFLWQNNSKDAKTQLPDGTACLVQAHGRASFNHRFAMVADGGHFASPGSGPRISNAAKASNAITIEATITPLGRADDDFEPILTLSSGKDTRNLTIGQRGGNLTLRLRTPENGLNGDKLERQLSRLTPGHPHHLVAAYSQGNIAVYINGEQVWARPRLQGDFSNWEPMELTFGDEAGGGTSWHGILENIAIYDRFLDTEEARQNHDALQLIATRSPVPQTWNVEVRLERATPMPTLDEINPYTEALVCHQYKVLTKPPTPPLADDILIHHWAILNSETMPTAKAKPGDTLQLQIQPFAQNPQLKSLRQKNDFADNFDLKEYFDLTPFPR